METVASKEKNQPAPPHVIFDDLVSPNRQPSRPWLHLLDDEVAPTVLESARPTRVVWSSLWTKRPDAQVVFDLSGGRSGTDLRWTLLTDQPAPDDLRMHTRDAIQKGETADRLAVLPAWWESQYFTSEEQAALTLAEQVTRIGDEHTAAPPAIDVEQALSPQQVAAVTWLAVAINGWNRIAIASHYPVAP
ncbi:carboxymuconolactone decarboxylase family protein [Gordonia terrae]